MWIIASREIISALPHVTVSSFSAFFLNSYLLIGSDSSIWPDPCNNRLIHMGECGLLGALGIYHRMSTVFPQANLKHWMRCSGTWHTGRLYTPQPASSLQKGRAIAALLPSNRERCAPVAYSVAKKLGKNVAVIYSVCRVAKSNMVGYM